MPEEHHHQEKYVVGSEISPSALEGLMGIFFQQLESLSDEVAGLSSTISELSTRMTDLQESIAERPVVRTTFLSELGSSEYTLTAPIPVVIEEYETESMARWPEVEAAGAGASELEAIIMLKKDIVSLYEDLRSTPRSNLGSQAATALAILKSSMRKKRG